MVVLQREANTSADEENVTGSIFPKRNLSRLGVSRYIHPFVLRDLDVIRPKQVWGIDITYIPMRNGFMYLTAIIDVYSRFIVGS